MVHLSRGTTKAGEGASSAHEHLFVRNAWKSLTNCQYTERISPTPKKNRPMCPPCRFLLVPAPSDALRFGSQMPISVQDYS